MGTDAYVEKAVDDAVERYSNVLQEVHRLAPDVAVAVIQTAVNQRPMHLMRQMDPDATERPLHTFDTSVDDCLSRVLRMGAGGLTHTAKVLRGLPTTLGGAGIPRLAMLRRPAHVACLVQAMVALEQRSPLLSTRVKGFALDLPIRKVRLLTDILPICKVTERVAGGVEEVTFAPPFKGCNINVAVAAPAEAIDVDDAQPRLQDRAAAVCYGQRVLTYKAYDEAHRELLDSLRDSGHWAQAAMVRSTEVRRPVHGWILSALSSMQYLRLTRDDYVDAMRHRLLLADFTGSNGERRYCACQKLRIDRPEHQLHLLACTATAKERVRTHNHLRDATAAFAKAVVGEDKVAMEQTLVHEGRPVIRMDVVIMKPDGQKLLVDTGHTSPAGRFAVPPQAEDQTGAAHVRCRAAAAYEEHKRNRARLSLPETVAGLFHPVIFETTGCLGDGAVNLLRIIAGTHVNPAVCNDKAARARRYYLRKVGTILARGCARCIQAVRADSTAAQFEEDDWAQLGALDQVGYAALPLNFDEGQGPAGAAPDAAPQQEVQLLGAGGGGGGGP